jgi:5'(3')-deoxyribonucleotidase
VGLCVGEARFVLGVDLDGVCADFYGGLRNVAAEWLGVPIRDLTDQVTYGLPEWQLDRAGGYELLHRFAVVQRDLFRNLVPVSGAPAVLRRLAARDVRIRIITHRLFIKHFHREAVEQTTQWLEHHGIPYWDLCFMRDKAAVGADLYIEDAPGNVKLLRADGHPTIVFTNSTNPNVPPPRADTWDDVETLVLEAQERWKRSREAEAKALPGE